MTTFDSQSEALRHRFEAAQTIVAEAAELAMRMRPPSGGPSGTQKSAQDWLTEADGAVEALIAERITTRRPAAYLTGEAWLQGVPFYVDERVIVPRSYLGELLFTDAVGEGGLIDDPEEVERVLDLKLKVLDRRDVLEAHARDPFEQLDGRGKLGHINCERIRRSA